MPEIHPLKSYVEFFDWLDDVLRPIFGPPDIGPYNSVREHAGDSRCPVCGLPMRLHRIDMSTGDPILICPGPELEEPRSHDPLNDLGMTKS